MVGIFVGSTDPYAGKSLLCIVLGLRLQEQGRRVGYFKPLGLLPTRVEEQVVDEDAAFIREVLQLPDAPGDLSPVVIGPDLYRRALSADVSRELGARITEAYRRLAAEREVMLIGGVGAVPVTGKALGLDAHVLTDLLGCKALLIARYQEERSLDGIIASSEALGKHVVGVVLNDVAADHLPWVREEVMPYLEQRGLRTFGALPHDPILRSVSVGELAQHLNAEMLCCPDKAEGLVEHFVVGAMNVESALRYFRRTPNKAVITGGDRSDIQLAALETASRCVVLTGGLHPSSPVITRSQELRIPLLLSRDDTLTVVGKIEWLLGRVRIREQAKITRATELAREHLDFEALQQAFGLG